MTNFNEKAEKMGIDTLGYDVTEVTKYLSDEMKERFAKASEDLSKAENKALVAACYDVLAQMKAVSSSGKMELSDRAIIDTQALILAEK